VSELEALKNIRNLQHSVSEQVEDIVQKYFSLLKQNKKLKELLAQSSCPFCNEFDHGVGCMCGNCEYCKEVNKILGE
jgi:hypothetical protein